MNQLLLSRCVLCLRKYLLFLRSILHISTKKETRIFNTLNISRGWVNVGSFKAKNFSSCVVTVTLSMLPTEAFVLYYLIKISPSQYFNITGGYEKHIYEEPFWFIITPFFVHPDSTIDVLILTSSPSATAVSCVTSIHKTSLG